MPSSDSSSAARLFAVVGDPVAHSLSPAMHNAAIQALGLDARYVALRTTHQAFPALVKELLEEGGGCSVTRPFKDDAFALTGDHTDVALRTRAVNCISGDAGRPLLDNTDITGVLGTIAELISAAPLRTVRIYGTGGAARAAALAVHGRDPGARIEIASRTAERVREFATWAGSEQIAVVDAAVTGPLDLLIWATHRGDVPDLPDGPLFDMNYRVGGTELVRLMRTRKRPAIDGRAMLVHQGVAAFRRFFGVEPPVEVMRRAVEEALAS